LHTIDDDNSNVILKEVGDYVLSIVKSRSRNGSFLNISISIDDIPHTLLQYLEYSVKNKKVIKSE
jgi:hypothetical protein